MRSVFFQRPLEFHLETTGDEWVQGDSVTGSLKVRNSGTEPVELEAIKVFLAYGLFRKLKAGDEDIWEVRHQEVLTPKVSVSPSEEKKIDWTLNLPSDCPISDKAGSLFLLYGTSDACLESGRINLRVALMPILLNFLQTFVTQFSFARKYEKRKKEWTEVKLAPPPNSKDFPTLDHVLCDMRVRDSVIEVTYNFKLKSMGQVGENLKVTRKNRTVEQQLKPEDYLQPGGFPNRNFFRENIQQALETAKPRSLF